MKVKSKIIILIVLAALLLPLAIYIYQFGTSLSDDHFRWAEFGSIFSGIYSPLIALVALLIISIQMLIQRSMSKHQLDQEYVSCAREDINFYICKLELYLDERDKDGVLVKDYINTRFRFLSRVELARQTVVDQIISFHKRDQHIVDVWMALYSILKGLESGNSYQYERNFHAAKLRISSCLSFGTCVAIDNMYYVVSGDCQSGNYYYSEAI